MTMDALTGSRLELIANSTRILSTTSLSRESCGFNFPFKSLLTPFSCRFEKMFAGNFLGDVGRRIILKLAQEGVLMQGVVTAALQTKDSLKAHHLVDFER